MGLFDFFKRKKEPSMPEALVKVHKLFFPNGIEQQQVLTEQLWRKFDNRYTKEEVTNNYIFVLTCLFMDKDKSIITVEEKVAHRLNNRLTRADIRTIYNYAIDNNEELSQTMGLLNAMQKLCESGTDEDKIPDGYGEFGLEVTNPIPIHGVPENELYLRKLRCENGNVIKWKRLGSTGAPNIAQIIDNYEIYDTLGNKICNLYLCPYHRKTSNKVPKGFIFEGQKIITSKPLLGKVLPLKQFSYAVGENGEPMLVFYRSSSRLFVNRKTANDEVGYFLNIRRPYLIDVTGKDRIDIPPIPAECDGIILTGYGESKSTAFIVKDFKSQTMEFPL